MIGIFLKNWDFKDRLSLYRKPLMGVAIIWIFILHSGKIENSLWDTIRYYGWTGVDTFFFLSAIGLCYSLNKDSSTLAFYKRRAKRILPTWLFVLFAVHFLGLICNHYLPRLPFYVPDSVIKCITWYTGTGFWLSDFLTGEGWFYEWYVPSLLAFYLFTPYLNKRSNSILFLLFVVFFVIGYLFRLHNILINTHFFYNRIPVFIIGLLYYRLMMKQNNEAFNIAIISCSFIGVLLVVMNSILCIEIPKEQIALFCVPPCLIFLTYVIEFKYLKTFLSFYGGISLELYLVHLYKRPHYLVSLFCENKFLIILITFIVCTIVAFLLQKLINKVSKKLF